MILEFTQTEKGSFESRFVATGNFNLHIESEEPWFLTLSQKGTPNENASYCTTLVKNSYEVGPVFDSDFGALLYPKWIEVELDRLPTLAEVTFEDEV